MAKHINNYSKHRDYDTTDHTVSFWCLYQAIPDGTCLAPRPLSPGDLGQRWRDAFWPLPLSWL